ncbi:hypothetical protein [Novosphingobium sp. 9]|uniref:hypothetical protein n=1 Tax=Novosphingobium sp. 9 TaxID=2025349 RepID=UPI0021B4FF55|nr:hypothetical protein [Novosphingobium sp. 9]
MNTLRIIACSLAAVSALALASCKDKSAPQPAPTQSAAPTEAVVTRQSPEDWLKAHFAGDLRSEIDSLRYAKATVDLNGDGKDEVLLYAGGSMLCGSGGCDLIVLTPDGDSWRMVGDLSVVQMPVGVLDSKTNGWRDLAVSVSGGGADAGVMRVPFDGKAYADNPTVAPAEPSDTLGKVLIPQAELQPLPAPVDGATEGAN